MALNRFHAEGGTNNTSEDFSRASTRKICPQGGPRKSHGKATESPFWPKSGQSPASSRHGLDSDQLGVEDAAMMIGVCSILAVWCAALADGAKAKDQSYPEKLMEPMFERTSGLCVSQWRGDEGQTPPMMFGKAIGNMRHNTTCTSMSTQSSGSLGREWHELVNGDGWCASAATLQLNVGAWKQHMLAPLGRHAHTDEGLGKEWEASLFCKEQQWEAPWTRQLALELVFMKRAITRKLTRRTYFYLGNDDYDPADNPKLNGDCFWACLAFQCAHQVGATRKPNGKEVRRMRAFLEKLWRLHPECLAKQAAEEGMKADEYVRRILRRGWGGLPEIKMLASHMRLNLLIVNGTMAPLWRQETVDDETWYGSTKTTTIGSLVD